MIRPKLVIVNNDRADQSRSDAEAGGVCFEWSKKRLVAYCLSLFLSLCFMFTLGVFVGRGYSVVKPDDFSLKGRFLRFLGLDKQIGAPIPKASTTWEDPKKMIASLDYYQDLTGQNHSPDGLISKTAPPSSPPVKETPAAVAKQPAPGPVATSQPVKPPPAVAPTGRFTLLVASLKENDARPLVAKLTADGYSPFVESLDLGSTRWNRILLGSFDTRQAAIAFADEFNRKEKTEAMVISTQPR